MSRTARTVIVYAVVIAVVVMVVNSFVSSATEPEELTLNQLQEKIEADQVSEVTIKQKSNHQDPR